MFMIQWRLPMTFLSNSALLSSFLAAEGCSAANIHARMKTVYGEMCISDCAVRKWVRILKGEDPRETIVRDRKRSGQTVNSERYISTLRAFKLRLRRVRRDKDSILQHDNARPHTSRQTQDALRQLELTTLPHPAYIPDLAPSDYYLFPQLKKYLKSHHYDNDEEVIADVRRWCRGQSSESFTDGVRQLVKRWRLCVDRDGDYVEK
ncbi:transposase [Plakobranchus ocellatus]|uniref:Transposase n=1 Tax=Plakobranchus ocellatus TaxID=259542 RepID=A0AAV4BFK4_9GAST|nr:transposase [Plakobranchus ocellatus]